MRRHFSLPFTSAILVTAGVFGYFALTTPGFATANTTYVVISQFTLFGLAALGMGTTMLAGEFDLAFPYTAALAGIVAMQVATADSMVLGLAAGVALGLLVGVIGGVLINALSIPSLVLTLGTGLVLSGIAYLVSETTVVTPDPQFALSLQAHWWIFSPSSLISLGLFVAVGLFLGFAKPGREILAIGGGRVEAIAAGVPLWRPILVAFAISGTLAGFTGGLVAAQTGGAGPTSFNGVLLNAVTAAFIGGVSLRGGRGNPVGIALGVLTLGFLGSGLSARGAPYYVTTLATASILLVLLVLELGIPWARQRLVRLSLRHGAGAAGPFQGTRRALD